MKSAETALFRTACNNSGDGGLLGAAHASPSSTRMGVRSRRAGRRSASSCTLPGRRFVAVTAWAAWLSILLLADCAHAYVGPGAGIAFLTTAALFLTTLLLALLALLLWPIRQLIRLFTRKRPPNAARVARAVIVGLDGLDPDLVQRFMSEGRLPNLQRLGARGTIGKLATTTPAMSPVAWSSFATGVSPAKHGIFDFLTRDPRSYVPTLSSAEVGGPRHQLKLGPWRIPVGRPQIRMLRKSRPFWKLLGQYRVPCSILRVPITFPPEPFDGTLLSAMCVPDLQGTQGSFSYYSSEEEEGQTEGGQRWRVEEKDGALRGTLYGPENPVRAGAGRLELPFRVEMTSDGQGGTLHIGKEHVALRVGAYTDWVEVAFPMALGLKLRGICRFRLIEGKPRFRLYASPVNIDPARPILPISHPFIFSVFLAKLCGRFATLGLAEDTWALNERVLDEDAFLEQAWANHAERESMFFEMLRRTPRGLVSCVFDGTDRIQHMFMRYMDDGHPATRALGDDQRYRDVIADTYARVDEMIGRVMKDVDIDDPRNLLLVISDHGFKTFRRGVNLNTWLRDEGYLALKEGREQSGEWFQGVDWSRTRAFALGLGGIFLNIKGREAHGIVSPGAEAHALADEIAGKLSGLEDPAEDAVCIREAFAAHRVYRGPYAEEAPDLIVGYAPGWRVSWNGAKGRVDGTVFSDNTKAWSGDHCIDPRSVPGVVVSNRALGATDRESSITDIAPTVLDLFGIPAPRYMDGRSLAPAT